MSSETQRYFPHPFPRRRSVGVDVGGVVVGGDAPVVVQSMTNTDTADVDSTVAQVAALFRAGSEIVRITVDRDESAAAVPRILLNADNEMFRINTQGTYNVIEAAVKLGIRKIVIASSETVYGVCFADGKVVPFRVAGSSQSDNWRFRVVGRDKLSTPMGSIEAVHLKRERDHDDGQKIEVWLSPAHDWLPVRVLSNEADGDFLDQVVQKIERP